MNVRLTLTSLLLCAFIATAREKRLNGEFFDLRDDDEGYDNEDSDIPVRKSHLLNVDKRVFDCKQKYDKCSGIIKCCGTLQCFWPEGYSLTTSGRCVDCVQTRQKCQRNEQCCSGMVCHKESRYYIDGQCGVKKFTGSECHEDSQCISGTCHTSIGQKVKGYGGSCA